MSQKDQLTKWAAVLMTHAGLESMRVSGISFELDVDIKPSLPKAGSEHEESFHEWLRENGCADKIKTGVPWQTAAALIRTRLEEGKSFPDYVKYSTAPKIKIRRSKR